MFESTNPKQPFYVANKISLSQENQRVLTSLYQPLIGVVGMGLYTTLINEFDTIPFAGDYKTLYQLQDQTNTNLKNIFIGLHHLEAVGLVKTFIGQNPILGDVIIFKLCEVPSAQEFFSTSLLSSMLLEIVGVVTFKNLVKRFTPNEFSGLKDASEVTSGFFDVFHLNSQAAIEPPTAVKEASQEIGKKVNVKDNIQLGETNKQVDWDFLKDLFDTYHIPKSEVDNHRKDILELMTFYNLSEQELVNDIILTVSPGQKSINMKAVQSVLVENFGQNKNKKSIQKQLQKKKPTKNASEIINGLSSQDNVILKEINSYSSIDYLYHLKEKKGGYVTANEKRVVFKLQNQYGLTPQLINVLIRTCLEYDAVLTSTLADRIANNWLQAGITTPPEALNHVHKWRNGKQKTSKGQPRYYRNTKQIKDNQTNWKKEKADQDKRQTSQISDEEINSIFREFGKNQ